MPDRFNPSESGLCVRISGHVKQVLNIVEDCKQIPQLGSLIQFSGIPEAFAHTLMPTFKVYKNAMCIYAEGINVVPLTAFFEQEGWEEEYPGLFKKEGEEEVIMAAYADVQALAAEWGFKVEGQEA